MSVLSLKADIRHSRRVLAVHPRSKDLVHGVHWGSEHSFPSRLRTKKASRSEGSELSKLAVATQISLIAKADYSAASGWVAKLLSLA